MLNRLTLLTTALSRSFSSAASNPFYTPSFHLNIPSLIPQITTLVDEAKEKLQILEKDIENNNECISYNKVFKELEFIFDPLYYEFGLVSHLMSVKTSDELREAYTSIQPLVVDLTTSLYQSESLFKAVSLILQDSNLTDVERRVANSFYLAAKNKGVDLAPLEKEKYKDLSQDLASLSTNFSNNVLDSTKEYSLYITKETHEVCVQSLPSSLLNIMKENAKDKFPNSTIEDGPFKITLDGSCYVSFMKNCADGSLREKVWRAYSSRSSSGKSNNLPIINKILRQRFEMARLVGYDRYSDLSISTKMAKSVFDIESMIDNLRSKSLYIAKKEIEMLKIFAKTKGFEESTEWGPWDVPYFSNLYEKEVFHVDEEELRTYFPLKQVLSGLFTLLEDIFDIRIEIDNEVKGWDETVDFYKVFDKSQGSLLAAFYLDPYSRPKEKRGGAWMNSLVGRTSNPKLLERDESKLGVKVDSRVPIAYLVLNQMPPSEMKPSLMSHNEVLTLFHEFGHGLQHMLTTVNDGGCSGIENIEWDAVELPSQFLENFTYDKNTLKDISGHFENKAKIPDSLIEKIISARNHMAAFQMIRQLNFAKLDLDLHGLKFDEIELDENFPLNMQKAVSQHFAVDDRYIEENRFICSFSHIFGGGYSAGYYSYKWAEVLSCDSFSAFLEDDIMNDRLKKKELGLKFRSTVLSLGGSKHPSEVFFQFRGREPSGDALLKMYNLEKA